MDADIETLGITPLFDGAAGSSSEQAAASTSTVSAPIKASQPGHSPKSQTKYAMGASGSTSRSLA